MTRPIGPRVKEDRSGFSLRFFFAAFLGMQFVGLTRYSIMAFVGDWFNTAAAGCVYGSILLLIPLIILYSKTAPAERLSGGARIWIAGVLLVISVNFIQGWVRDYDVKEIIQDYVPYLVILSFVSIGAKKVFWEDIWVVLPWVLAIGLLVNGMAMTGFSELISGDLGERVGRDSMAYRTQVVLSFWTILFLTIHGRPFFKQVLVMGAMGFVFAQQILFQKRIGTAEIIVYLIAYFVLLPWLAGPRLSGRHRSENRKIAAKLFGAACLGGLVIVGAAPGLVFSQAKSLLDRFEGSAEAQNKTETGFLNALIYENERVAIAGEMLSDFGAEELLLGRGMGGYFQIVVELPESERVQMERFASFYLEDVGLFGRRGLEIGLLMPFLKGGVLLMIVYWAGVVMALSRFTAVRHDMLSLTCWIYVLLETLYLCQGGGFIMAASYRLIIQGACVGRCLLVHYRPSPKPVLSH